MRQPGQRMASSLLLLVSDDAALDGRIVRSNAADEGVTSFDRAGSIAPQRSQNVCEALFWAWHVRHAMVVVTAIVWYRIQPNVIGRAA